LSWTKVSSVSAAVTIFKACAGSFRNPQSRFTMHT
jgi:hypothetical protein